MFLIEQQLALVANPKVSSSPYIFCLELTFLPHGPLLFFLFFTSLSPLFLEGQIILFCVWIVGHCGNKVLAYRLKFSR